MTHSSGLYSEEDVEFLQLNGKVRVLRVLHLDNWKSFSEPVDFTIAGRKRATERPSTSAAESRAPRCRDLRHGMPLESPLLGRCPRSPAGHAARAARSVGSACYHPHLLLGPDKPQRHRRRDRPRCAGCDVESASNRLLRGGVPAGEIVRESWHRVRSEDEQAIFERRGQGGSYSTAQGRVPRRCVEGSSTKPPLPRNLLQCGAH